MTALTADVNLVQQKGEMVSHPVVASDIIYKGALCKINAAGNLAPCAAEAGSQFAGVAYENVDNSAGIAGAKSCRVEIEGIFDLTIAGATLADVGSKVYATDDGLVTVTEGTGSKQIVGNIVKFNSATSVSVKLSTYAGVGAS